MKAIPFMSFCRKDMRKFFFVFCFFSIFYCQCLPLWSESPYAIVCVHIGEIIPSYIESAFKQARLFNRECSIVLIANAAAVEQFSSSIDITVVCCESLPMTPEHQKFLEKTHLRNDVLDGYLRYTSERFLYLYDYMKAFAAENVFHIENDVMLYADLGELLPLFQKHYPGIAATFESPLKCIPGFMFIANPQAMQRLADFFAVHAIKSLMDMKVIALFWQKHPEIIDCLPMVMKSYFQGRLSEQQIKRKQVYSNHINEFQSIFDGAAIGVFFDGIEASRGDFPPGTEMKKLFNPSLWDYQWCEDEQGRKVPYARYGGEVYRINNLHIASKRLEMFSSF